MLYIIKFKDFRFGYEIHSFWHDKEKAIAKVASLIDDELERIIVEWYSMAPNGRYMFEAIVYSWHNE